MFNQYDSPRYDPKSDETIPKLSDLRKTKLTLGAINRLRKIEDVRTFEKKKDLENIQRQFAPVGGQAESGGF